MDIEDFLEVLRKIVVCSLGLLALCVTNYGWTELLSFVHTVSIYSMSLPRFIVFNFVNVGGILLQIFVAVWIVTHFEKPAGFYPVQNNEEEAQRRQQRRQVQKVYDKGKAYIKKIHASNDAIRGEEISAKIAKMEQVIEQIFQRAEEHPEIIPDLKKMMDYYLPMTVKLLDAYEDMDRQPIQGETICASKKEIEDTLDTLNEAFAKLLDSVFQDTAWDMSSDIFVVNTILAQEGLTGNDFIHK